MPLLDVSDVLSDSDFADTIDVIRTAMVVGTLGRNTPTVQTFFGVSAVVTPANSLDLQRLPDLERTSGAIQVITMFRLTDLAPGFTADQVIWPARGVWPAPAGAELYTVDLLDDWTRFGAGFVKATCRHTSLE